MDQGSPSVHAAAGAAGSRNRRNCELRDQRLPDFAAVPPESTPDILAAPGGQRTALSGEFELIARHFTRPVQRAALGVGDDCALLRVAPGMQLAVSSDMLVEGRHFLSTVAPERLGHKALAVNLSDLAACGAEPLAFTLALALPRADEPFVVKSITLREELRRSVYAVPGYLQQIKRLLLFQINKW